jgi:ElaB/YqjD/DUF883 family membrane-anchored ribosome-binding protein
MANEYPTTPETLTDQARAAGDEAMNQAARARGAVSQAARTAVDKVDQGRVAAADRLAHTASSVRERSENLPGGPRVREFANAAADRLSSTADYMRTHDLSRMGDDVEDVVRNHPGPALLIAAAFGFLLGRAMARD